MHHKKEEQFKIMTLATSAFLAACSSTENVSKTHDIFGNLMSTCDKMMPTSRKENTSYSAFITGIPSSVANVIVFHAEDKCIIDEMKAKKIPLIAFQSGSFKSDFDAFATENGLIKENSYKAHIMTVDDLKTWQVSSPF
ncbi:MAG: hypothetical protein KBD31_03965 [Proteobacteria bacterium]|nr:hypothetical protein [Pseudomonadota bacterium]